MSGNMKMIIGGLSVDASDGSSMKNYNPFTGELLGTVPSATKKDVDLAVKNAVNGQKEWAALRNDQREEIIEKFLTIFDSHKEEIAQMVCKESGKSISECRGEVSIIAPIFRAYVRAAASLYGSVLPPNTERRNGGDIIITMYEPLGVCAAIAPFNYPISTMANKIAPALCAGNSVIMKPASDTPMSIIMFCKLMLEAGFPANTVQVVTGSGSKIGKWLTDNKDVALISLTGSSQVGSELHKNASKHLQHLGFELGGNDPMIICADCDLDSAVKEAVNGRIYNCGQICTADKRFIVENSIKEAFTAKLIEEIKSRKGGNPYDPESFYGCMINKEATDKVMIQIKETIALGAKIAYGGNRISDTLFEPTVITDVSKDMPIMNDMEVFGFVFPIIGFDTIEEAIEIANNTVYGLSSSVMTSNMRTAMKVAMEVKAGTCVINTSGDYRTSYHAFGGYKMSGLGREGAFETIKEFSEMKSIAFAKIC